MTVTALPVLHPALLLVVAVLACSKLVHADDFKYGRATFYDDNGQGACQYFNNIPEWYAAWPDTMEGFSGSCGKCVEVACVDQDFSDGYGQKISRKGMCYDEGKSVVVKITDACPCVHQNFYSNKRWCCGDMRHLDLGRKAFQELASENWGVIGLKFREVDCNKGLGVHRI
ncbi:hypothetical protein OEZ86_000325 [Tetradesmus obliquus]|nr:hypothetical protein OEZ86_000325 [Tetradesmus obliquus]